MEKNLNEYNMKIFNITNRSPGEGPNDMWTYSPSLQLNVEGKRLFFHKNHVTNSDCLVTLSNPSFCPNTSVLQQHNPVLPGTIILLLLLRCWV